MKNVHKFLAVTDIKFQTLFQNMTVMLGPVMTLGLVAGMRYLYGTNLAGGGELPAALMAIILNMGLSFNVSMNGFLMVGTAIAEEKEKHTLRVLMTSSVTGIQYFWGTICIPFLMIMLINVLILPLSGCTVLPENLPVYFIITALSGFTSCIIGMIVGIFAKNQMSANLIATPLLFVFALVPIFGNLSEGLAKASQFLFTGVLSAMAERMAAGEVFRPGILHIVVLAVQMAAALAVFLLIYKRNGYEK